MEIGRATLTTDEVPNSTPIFADAGPLERKLREMDARGELDLPTPHWHVHRDPLPGERRPGGAKKVITAHRTREPAGHAILEYPSRVMEITRTTPKRVVFEDNDTDQPSVLVVMRTGQQYKASLKECRRPKCQVGLLDIS